MLAAGSLAAVGLVVAAAPAAATPPPPPIVCGTVITTNAVLQQDLNCSADGLLIGASNITVDLNGHTISGSGASACGGPFFATVGVRAADSVGYSGVTVKNGTIQAFSAGILSDFLVASNFVGLRLLDNGCGYLSTLGNVDRGQIAFSVISGNRVGVLQGPDTGRITVTRSVLANNTAGASAGQLTGDTFTWNDIHDNGTGIQGLQVDGYNVVHNWIHNNGTGIAFVQATCGFAPHTITANAIFKNGRGVILQGDSCQPGHQVQNNVFLSNDSVGLVVETDHCCSPGAPTITISRNVFVRNGFSPDPLQPNINDGLNTVGAVTISSNAAIRNADYGIEASGAVTDGGGNIAFANGNAAQCLGVTCPRFRGF